MLRIESCCSPQLGVFRLECLKSVRSAINVHRLLPINWWNALDCRSFLTYFISHLSAGAYFLLSTFCEAINKLRCHWSGKSNLFDKLGFVQKPAMGNYFIAVSEFSRSKMVIHKVLWKITLLWIIFMRLSGAMLWAFWLSDNLTRERSVWNIKVGVDTAASIVSLLILPIRVFSFIFFNCRSFSSLQQIVWKICSRLEMKMSRIWSQ